MPSVEDFANTSGSSKLSGAAWLGVMTIPTINSMPYSVTTSAFIAWPPFSLIL
jgi:hypothetical protein